MGRHSVLFRDDPFRPFVSEDRQHVGFGQLRAHVPGPTLTAFWMKSRSMPVAARLPALCHHVGTVVGLRSKKEMRRVDARRVIAMVEDAHLVGDSSVGQFPRHARGNA